MDKAFLLYFCGWFIFLLKDTEQSTEGAGLHIIYPTALIMSKRMLNYLLMQELIQGICLFFPGGGAENKFHSYYNCTISLILIVNLAL